MPRWSVATRRMLSLCSLSEERLEYSSTSFTHLSDRLLLKFGSMLKADSELASEYCLLRKTEAMVFDITASNTGQWKGSVSRFEKNVGRFLLWLPCRHHIPELHIKHSHEVLLGPSKGPQDHLFKRFKKIFGTIVTTDQSVWIWPIDPNW